MREGESADERKREEGGQEEERTLKIQVEGGRYRHTWPMPPHNPRLWLVFLQCASTDTFHPVLRGLRSSLTCYVLLLSPLLKANEHCALDSTCCLLTSLPR